MTAHVAYGVPGPKQIKQLREAYERALAVRATLPANHLASIAAKKLTDAFEKPYHPVSVAAPQGGSAVAMADMVGDKRSRGRGSRISRVNPH